MKSKENPNEMIKEITKVIEAYGLHRTRSRRELDGLAADLEKITEEYAIGFTEWIRHRYILDTSSPSLWFLSAALFMHKNDRIYLTTSELFTLYINSKNNSNG